MLHLLSEEDIVEECLEEYFQELYRIVCVSERPAGGARPAGVVRSTYLVDWEQLVHLLEDYIGFGEDIVEVTPVAGKGTHSLRRASGGAMHFARA